MIKIPEQMESYEFLPVIEHYNGDIEHAARVCDHCGNGMMTGFCFASGHQYACSNECLTSLPAYDNKENGNWTIKEWCKHYDEDDGDSYWTDWYECDEEECHICESIIGERDDTT